MKNINFRRNQSMLRIRKEDKMVKKVNWDRIIYLVLLVGVLIFSGGYLLKQYVFVAGEGQVLFDKLSVSLQDNAVIKGFCFEEGEYVKRGDTLFYYEQEYKKFRTPDPSGMNWVDKEINNSQKALELNKIEQDFIKRKIWNLKKEIKISQEKVILNLTSKKDLMRLQRELDEARMKNEKLVREESYHKKHIALTKVNAPKTKSGFMIHKYRGVYTSPIDGLITRVFKDPHEVALRSEMIMSIHRSKNIYLKAFFEQTDIKHLFEGDVVTIEFPDGTESEGKINRFYTATYPLPPEFQKKYEPVHRSLAADIIPLNANEALLWQKYYKMSVKVYKKTFKY